MKIGQSIGTLIQVAFVGACIYTYLNWESIGPQKDDIQYFAESACTDGIRSRFQGTGINVYEVNENANGFTVRATITLPNDRRGSVVCLTTRQGGVRDISLEER